MCHIRMVCACAIRQRMRLRLIIMVWTKYKSNSEKTENVLGSIGVNVNDAICVFLSIRLLLYFSLFLSLSNSLYDFVFMSSLQGAPLHNFRAYTKRASTANGQHASSGDTQSIVLVSVAFGAAQHLYMWPVQKDGGQVQSAELYLFTVHIGYITIYNLYNILNECIFLLAVVVVHYHGCMPFFSFLLVCSRLCCPIVIAHTHTHRHAKSGVLRWKRMNRGERQSKQKRKMQCTLLHRCVSPYCKAPRPESRIMQMMHYEYARHLGSAMQC